MLFLTVLGPWFKFQKSWNKREENTAVKNESNHTCTEVVSKTTIPTNWRAFLACRQCKQALTSYLGHEFLCIIPKYLSGDQMFICNRRENAQSVTNRGQILPCPQLWTNADEADMRVWLHCIHSTGLRKLIFSPDTDVYHIGLACVHLLQGNEIVVQLTKNLREGSRFLLFHNMVQALERDPDLAGIP